MIRIRQGWSYIWPNGKLSDTFESFKPETKNAVPVIMAEIPEPNNDKAPCHGDCKFLVHPRIEDGDNHCVLGLSVPTGIIDGYCKPGPDCPAYKEDKS